jgi:hypothetical protein
MKLVFLTMFAMPAVSAITMEKKKMTMEEIDAGIYQKYRNYIKRVRCDEFQHNLGQTQL